MPVHPSVLYIPIGRKTFDLEAAEHERRKSSSFLHEVSRHVVEPDSIVTSPEDLKAFLDGVDVDRVSTTIYQSVTFADGEFIETIIQQVKAPVIVWSVREPSVGGRLRLNSLTGGNSTSHVLRCAGHPYSFIFGNADEANVQMMLKVKLKVQNLLDDLHNLKIGVIGEHPPGFFFSGTDEEALHKQWGVQVEHFDLHKAFEECRKLPREKWEPAIERAEQQVIGLNRNDETVERFAQFSTYVKDQIEERDISAIAVRCWPDFFNELGAAACSTLSQFTEDGVVSSCESDIHGSVSMFILRHLSGGSAPYLGDLVHVNEAANSVVFWHCGAGAYSLAHPDQGAQSGVHPNRKMGMTMEFGLKPGRVTMFRVSYTTEGYRLLIMRGDALDTPKRFDGTSVEVKLETEVQSTLYQLMEEGFEPHYALVYEDVASELVELGRQLGLPTTLLTRD
jgi:L-fucose isomerase-like protein